MSADDVQTAINDFCEEIVKGYAGVITILCSDSDPVVVIHGSPNIGAVTIGGWVVDLVDEDEEDEDD